MRNHIKRQLRRAERELREMKRQAAHPDEDRLLELVEDEKYALLAIPGVYEVVSEDSDIHNDAMDLADALGVEYESAIEQLITSMSAEEILRIPGMAEVLLDEFNNELV